MWEGKFYDILSWPKTVLNLTDNFKYYFLF